MAIDEMVEEARSLGAHAVVGVDLDYEHIGGGSRSEPGTVDRVSA